MSFDLNSLREELISKKAAEDGLVAIGQDVLGWGVLGSLIAENTIKRYTISKVGSKILVIPYTFSEIEYKSGIAFDKSVITKAKVSGDGIFVTTKLKLWTIDGKVHKYFISQGRKAVKEIVNRMVFSN